MGLAAALAVAAGCSTAPVATEYPDLTYTHLPPIVLTAGTVEVVDGYIPTLSEPNVEHLFPLRPSVAMQQWAHDRLQVTGSDGQVVRFEVVQASVTETSVREEGGAIRRLFTTAHTLRYDMTLEARVEVRPNPSSAAVGFVRAIVQRHATLPEDATVNDREQLWFTMLSAAMNDLNREMEGQIRITLNPWLVN
ncbi:MAG: hypothetical protein RIE31_04555 [Alphaproteobacteria bacterium]